MKAGSAVKSLAPSHVCQGKAYTRRPRPIARRIFDAAMSAGIRKGILNLFLLVSGVSMKPGLTSVTVIAVRKRSTRIDSRNAESAAFEAEYAAALGIPRYAARLEIPTRFPRSCSSMNGIAAVIVTHAPITLVWYIEMMCSGFSLVAGRL